MKGPDTEVLKTEEMEDGSTWKYYEKRKIRTAKDGEILCQYILTTPGRIIYNKTIQDTIAV
jgi:DNA-directed RNA polymerase subunit beta'